ncbi:TPA: hypothetical protein HA239_04450 [Candidatus Woesearchaeota archaeon]|nr:Small primase-like protein with Toprim protein [archaeon GW2011_AR15]MBS3103883.1 hypothetical protein [Candidatus Woesearchaeota archaeon]HIH41640.1 hypothetical protein [Candidatus Woesearchaeota archaeon]
MEEAEEILGEIERLKESGKAVVAEGIKDLAALKKLGLKNIYIISAPLFEVCEKIGENNDETAILTDLDREGKLLYSKIKENLTRLGVKIDDRLRERLFRTKLVHMQGLDTYIENLMSS